MIASRARCAPIVSLLLSLSLALATSLAIAPRAHAQEPGGSIIGQLYVSDGDLGGGGMIDVWGTIGPLRLGGFLGVVSVPSDRDWHNRTMMPAGVHASLAIDLSTVDIVIVARGGIWGGASQESKLLAGGMFGGGAYLDVALDGGIALGAGAEFFGFFGGGDTWAFVPGLRLTWGRSVAVPEPEIAITSETTP